MVALLMVNLGAQMIQESLLLDEVVVLAELEQVLVAKAVLVELVLLLVEVVQEATHLHVALVILLVDLVLSLEVEVAQTTPLLEVVIT